MDKFVVYIFYITSNGYFYIGSSGDFNRRISRHLRELKDGTHHNLNLLNAWNKSDKNFFITTIETTTREEAFRLEEEMIKRAFNSTRKQLLCNIGLNSIAGDLLSDHPNRNDIISRITEKVRLSYSSMSSIQRKSKFGRSGDKNGMFGKKHSEETKNKISLRMTGHSFNTGRKLSADHIAKISERQKLRVGSKNSFFGKFHRDETKDRIRQANKGKMPTNVRKILTDSGIFNSCADAARFYSISQGLVTYRIKSKKYPNWKYIV